MLERDCPKLINKPLEDDVLFSQEGGNPDWKLLKDFLSREGPITKPQCVRLLQLTIDMLKKDPNLV